MMAFSKKKVPKYFVQKSYNLLKKNPWGKASVQKELKIVYFKDLTEESKCCNRL
jgi:hypothetical protein